jgi:hypothetical protein
VTAPCKFLLAVWLCCMLSMGALAQESGEGGGGALPPRHHPPQDQMLHEKFYSTWHMPDHPNQSCCNMADCYPTEIKSIGDQIYARRREDGKFILVPPEKVERNRDNPDGRNHLCAPPPRAGYDPADTVYCFALGGAT